MSEGSRHTLTSPSEAVGTAQPPRNPGLLPSLRRLTRGLSALFWGLPIALVVCVQTAFTDWLRPLGVAAPLLATALLFYGLMLLGYFQPQERVWRGALDRAKALALVNVGLAPFLFWWNRLPWHPFYYLMANLMVVTALLFLFALNPVLVRLTAMLPDETLRLETRLFTSINRRFLIAGALCVIGYLSLARATRLPQMIIEFLTAWKQSGQTVFFAGQAIFLFLVLLPVAVTMALLWKTKEVILASVFGQEPRATT